LPSKSWISALLIDAVCGEGKFVPSVATMGNFDTIAAVKSLCVAKNKVVLRIFYHVISSSLNECCHPFFSISSSGNTFDARMLLCKRIRRSARRHDCLRLPLDGTRLADQLI
jgi:hypothetical protein